VSYCLVPADRPIAENCPTCGCPAGTHIIVTDDWDDEVFRFLCVACDNSKDGEE